MAKKCFLSFHYKPDNWRVSQVKQMGAVTGQPILSSNDWEAVKKKGDQAIKDYIEANMKGKECLVVLVGKDTAGRRWVKHEIREACSKGIGVLGVYIHNMKDVDGEQTTKGSDPFAGVTVGGSSISKYAKMYSPPSTDSQKVYSHIAENLDDWVDEAIRLRK